MSFINPFYQQNPFLTMKKITPIALAAILTFMLSCQKDQTVQTNNTLLKPQIDERKYFTPSKEYLASLEALTTPSVLRTRSSCSWIEIPANSTDALANAVNDACEGGVIYLKAGNHTETKSITISKSVNIVGENGAVLKLKSNLTSFDPVNVQIVLKPAIHVFNAPRTLIQNIDIQTLDTDGAAALLFENSSESAVMQCKISKFQFSIWIQKSDRMTLMRNTIMGTSAWQTQEGIEAEGITIENGKSTYMADNDINNCVFGVWPCDQYGTSERNNFKGCLYGLVLCNVPPAYIMPSGERTGSLTPGNNWKVRNNIATDNIEAGYLVIDGANHNFLENNDAARNGKYDMELTADTYRFGFLTPLSYNNYVNAGNYPNIRIKDCGRNNTVIGGVKINTATDPCN